MVIQPHPEITGTHSTDRRQALYGNPFQKPELNSVALNAYSLEHLGERKRRQHDCDNDSHRGGHKDMVSPSWINKERRGGLFSQQVTSRHTFQGEHQASTA